jgi:hypothetical protein
MTLEDAMRRLGSASRKLPMGSTVTVYENVQGDGLTIVYHTGAYCNNALPAATLTDALRIAGDGDWQEGDTDPDDFPDKTDVAMALRYNRHLREEVR